MRTLYDNGVMDCSSGNIVASSEHANFPASHLLDTRISKYYKSLLASTVNIVFSLPATADCTVVGLVGHNLSTVGTAVIQGAVSDSWGSPGYESTVTTRVSGPMVLFFGSTKSYRYWRLVLTDTTVGAFEAGIIFIGGYVQHDPSAEPVFPENLTRNDIRSESVGGQHYASEGVQQKEYEFLIPFCVASVKTNIQTMYESAGLHTPVIMIHYDTTYGVIEPLYCTIRDEVTFTHLRGDNWKYQMNFRECK